MKKMLHIEGMSCNHCKMSVEKALGAVAGVTGAEVDLQQKMAIVTGRELNEDVLQSTVTDLGFQVTEIEEGV